MEGQNLKIVEQARDEIIKLLADKRHEHSLYMQRCKGITASIKDWKDKAKEAGAPRVAFNGLLKFIALNDKIDALTQDMDQADAEACDFLIERLGAFADTELGEAAVRAAERAAQDQGRQAAQDQGQGRRRRRQRRCAGEADRRHADSRGGRRPARLPAR